MFFMIKVNGWLDWLKLFVVSGLGGDIMGK